MGKCQNIVSSKVKVLNTHDEMINLEISKQSYLSTMLACEYVQWRDIFMVAMFYKVFPKQLEITEQLVMREL
jgi:hypothetical protein